MEREVRVSPDGLMVAIRSDNPEDAWNAWGVMHAINGGHWCKPHEVADWAVVTATQTPQPASEPVTPTS